MDVSSSEMEQQAAIRELIQQHYPDAHRITVDVSATGAGRHLRWHYSEDLIAAAQERDPSPTPSHTSTTLVDDDGDSQMGDEEERPRTPSRLSPFDPGSVVLTPKKEGWRGLRRERRIGGGFDWWHDHEGVEDRVTFLRDGSHSRQESPVDRAHLGPDALRLLELVEAERDRHRTALKKTPSPYYDDDDALSVASIATQATVIVDPRNPTKPTLFNGEMPIIRQPTYPDDATPGPSSSAHSATPAGAAVRRHLSTIQEEGSGTASGSGSGGAALRSWQPKAPEVGHVRIFRDRAGNWVREGSMGPDCDYHIDRKLLPPRIDVGPAPAARAGPSRRVVVQRTDTEPAIPVRLVPVVEIPMRRKAPRAAPPPPAPRMPNLRRSERLSKKCPA
ncbi:hypothetical protein C8Q80DRAFT_1271415 [Daedaleopsis nitida]|nr:hypothetical protein C8Q80DRAFT_1271415 [Daedaleopsis nitida]